MLVVPGDISSSLDRSAETLTELKERYDEVGGTRVTGTAWALVLLGINSAVLCQGLCRVGAVLSCSGAVVLCLRCAGAVLMLC